MEKIEFDEDNIPIVLIGDVNEKLKEMKEQDILGFSTGEYQMQ